MSIFKSAYDAVGIKAAPQRAQLVRRDPPHTRRGAEATYAVERAEQHGKAYGGGKDGIDWFYDAANIIAKAAVTAPFHFEGKDRKRYVMEKAPTDPPEISEAPYDLVQLFDMPNPWMDWQEHLHLAIIDLLAVGNFFWLKWNAQDDGSKPYALYRLAPPNVEVVIGKDKLIDHYKLHAEGQDPIEIPPQMVVHGRLPNPHSPHSMIGLGAIQAAPQAYDIELGLLEAVRTFFQKGAVLAGALESDKSIPEPNRRRIERSFKQLHQGSGNWFKVAFLEKGLHYRPIQANAQEAGYEALSKLSRDRVFAMLGVPKLLAGVDDGEGGLKMQEARRQFAEDTMGWFLALLQRQFTRSLTSAWGMRFKYDYGYQMPEEDRIKLAMDFSTLPAITVREARAKAGLPPLGPDYVDDEGVAIDDYVINLPGSSTESEGGTADASNPRGGRPPDRENTRKFDVSPNAGDRDPETDVNGGVASSSDRARRQQVGVVEPRKPAAKAITAGMLADGVDVMEVVRRGA